MFPGISPRASDHSIDPQSQVGQVGGYLRVDGAEGDHEAGTWVDGSRESVLLSGIGHNFNLSCQK